MYFLKFAERKSGKKPMSLTSGVNQDSWSIFQPGYACVEVKRKPLAMSNCGKKIGECSKEGYSYLLCL